MKRVERSEILLHGYFTANPTTMPWQRITNEIERGGFTFSGPMFMTNRIYKELSPCEILLIRADLQHFIKSKGSVDFIQIYKHGSTDRKIYCVDHMSEQIRNSGRYSLEELAERDYWTMLFREEY